jgi:glycerophosphoryl diester phosphodiesterase
VDAWTDVLCSPRRAGRAPLISVHAGAAKGQILGLEHYDQALSSGAELIEIDVRQTEDHVLVASHDPASDEQGLRPASTSAEGHREGAIPLFVDVIELLRGKVRLHLDVKDAPVRQLFHDLEAGGLEPADFLITSLEDEVVSAIKQAWPEVKVGLSLGMDNPPQYIRTRLSELLPVSRARRCDADFLSVHFRLARLGVLRRAAKHGYPILVWTVNERRDLTRFLDDSRTAGVVTDDPVLAVALREELSL